MSFNSNTKYVGIFNSLPFVEEISGNDLTVAGSNLFVSIDNGYQMLTNQYLYSINNSLSINNAFTITFDLISTNIGLAQNSFGAYSSINMPLIEIGIGSPIGNNFVFSSNVILIYEQSLVNNQNCLVVKLNSGAYVATSGPYSSGKLHQFVITYQSSPSTFQIYIDGLQISLSAVGSIPVSISASTVSVAINSQSFSPAYNVIQNQGIINNLFILNSFNNSITTQQEMFNINSQFMINTSLANANEIDYGILFNDPTAVKMTQIIDDGLYLYTSRTDGQILQGSPIFWQSRKDFADPNEQYVLNIISSPSNNITVANGFLQIVNGLVKL